MKANHLLEDKLRIVNKTIRNETETFIELQSWDPEDKRLVVQGLANHTIGGVTYLRSCSGG